MLGLSKKHEKWVLGGLGALAVYLVYTNLIAGPDIPASSQRSAVAPAA
jgi:hypothetical protein